MNIHKIEKLYHRGIEKLQGVDGIYYSFDTYVDYFDITEYKGDSFEIVGNELSFFFYPEQKIYTPFKKEDGIYYDRLCIAYKNEAVYFTRANFITNELFLYKYCLKHEILEMLKILDMKELDTYNLQIVFDPLSICSSNGQRVAMYYPENFVLKMEGNETFYFRDGDRFYFTAWFEQGEGVNYKYYEMYLVKDKDSNVLEKGFGCIEQMPDGKYIII